jgi:hypothetical protein
MPFVHSSSSFPFSPKARQPSARISFELTTILRTQQITICACIFCLIVHICTVCPSACACVCYHARRCCPGWAARAGEKADVVLFSPLLLLERRRTGGTVYHVGHRRNVGTVSSISHWGSTPHRPTIGVCIYYPPPFPAHKVKY